MITESRSRVNRGIVETDRMRPTASALRSSRAARLPRQALAAPGRERWGRPGGEPARGATVNL